MPRVFPSQINAPFSQLPLGILEWVVNEAYENMIGKDNPKYGVQIKLTATAPAEAVGLNHTENFIFGMDDDPGDMQNGVSEETFTKRAGKFDEFCQKVGTQGVDIREKSTEQVCAELKDQVIKSINEGKKEAAIVQWGVNKGQPNPYAGKYRVNPRWMAIDEIGEPVITGNVADLEAADPAPVAAAAPAPAPRAAAPMPPAARTAAPAARAAAAPAPRPAAPPPPAARRGR